MRDRMERLLVLPFSFGCASHSSVELGLTTRPKGPPVPRRQGGEERSYAPKLKTSRPSSGFLLLPKPSIAAGIQRLIKGIKSLSQLFFYKEDTNMEPEMEIGYPTDVKHVTHIGLDGSTSVNNNNVKGLDNLKAPELLSLSSISFKQFEVAMAIQARHADPSSNFG